MTRDHAEVEAVQPAQGPVIPGPLGGDYMMVNQEWPGLLESPVSRGGAWSRWAKAWPTWSVFSAFFWVCRRADAVSMPIATERKRSLRLHGTTSSLHCWIRAGGTRSQLVALDARGAQLIGW